jgi:hypothetical protein
MRELHKELLFQYYLVNFIVTNNAGEMQTNLHIV